MSTSSVSPFRIESAGAPNDVINSLWRGLMILELIAAEPEGLLAKTVSFRTGLNLSTCYHLLNTLVAAGYITRHSDSQRFILTGKVSFPSYTALAQARIVPRLLLHLHTLRDVTAETAYLSLCQCDEIVVSAIVESPQALKVSLLHAGYSGAAHATALGKAILAYRAEADVNAYLARFGLPALTPNTIADHDTFASELVGVRARGYSLDLEEFAPGVCCIGAPIFGATGRVAASLAISLPANRYHAAAAALTQQVVAMAGAATRTLIMLGYTAPEREDAVPAQPMQTTITYC
jgi:DNA-binding IclR family transcriptional regulator